MKYLKIFEEFHPGTERKKLASEERVLNTEETDKDKYDEVYAEIDMRMRPDENTLSMNDIEDICTSVLMMEPDEGCLSFINNVMFDYLKKRDEESEGELPTSVKDCINFFKEDDDNRHSHITDADELSFKEFYDWFTKGAWEDDLVKRYSKEEIKAEFDKQTKDPNQMKLPLD